MPPPWPVRWRCWRRTGNCATALANGAAATRPLTTAASWRPGWKRFSATPSSPIASKLEARLERKFLRKKSLGAFPHRRARRGAEAVIQGDEFPFPGAGQRQRADQRRILQRDIAGVAPGAPQRFQRRAAGMQQEPGIEMLRRDIAAGA